MSEKINLTVPNTLKDVTEINQGNFTVKVKPGGKVSTESREFADYLILKRGFEEKPAEEKPAEEKGKSDGGKK